jgi:hypothetical protein
MKIEEFIRLMDSFEKVFIEIPGEKIMTGELPCFEITSPYSKYSKAEYSNDSMDVYVGHTQIGIVYLDMEDGDTEKIPFDKYESTMFSKKKIFKDGKPVTDNFWILCYKEELHKVKNTDIYIADEPVGDSFVGVHSVHVDLSKVSFDHYKTGEPDYEKVAKLALDIAKLKANRKVINWYIDHTYPSDKDDKYGRLTNNYGEEAVSILKRNRINDWGYSPAPYHTKKVAPVIIKISGMSNLPKIPDILDRIEKNKQQTTAGNIMLPTVKTIMGLEDKYDWLFTKLSVYDSDIVIKQNELRAAIYNIILNDGLKTGGPAEQTNKISVDDFDVTIITTK